MKIITINIFHPKKSHEWYCTVGRKSKYKQIKNIKHSCRAGKDIYTLPHQDSVLSEIFVRPHLDDKGYIIEGEYCVNLDGDLKEISKKSHKSLACVDELRIF